MEIYKKLAAKQLGISGDKVAPEQRHKFKRKFGLSMCSTISPFSVTATLNSNLQDLCERVSRK